MLQFSNTQKQAGAVIVTLVLLTLLEGLESTLIFKGSLVGISAGAETLTRYRLSLKFPSNEQMIVVDGDRQEIEWLYNGLSKWTGIQATP